MTTPSIDFTEAPSASVEKIQEELAGISLDPPLNGNGGNLDEPTPAIVKPTGEHIASLGCEHNCLALLYVCEGLSGSVRRALVD